MYHRLRDPRTGIESLSVRRLVDGVIFPRDNTNSDYRTYLVWVAVNGEAPFEPLPTAAELSTQKDRIAATIDGNVLIQAVAQLDFEERQKLQVSPGQTLLTAAQCKARVRVIYRSLL